MANDKNARAELIAALVTDKYSGFKDGDETVLEACSDTRLDEFRAASEARKVAERAHGKLESEHSQVAARLKVAEDRIKVGEQQLSKEEFLQRAPDEYKVVLQEHAAQEATFRASIISQLKDCGAQTEDELKLKSTDDLKVLAAYARVEVPNFSQRGVPVERGLENNTRSYAAPNPYAAALKALKDRESKAAH